MEVRGLMKVNVDISFEEAFNVVVKGLGFESERTVLEADDARNETGKRGLFWFRDISYHGSPQLEYHLITHDEKEIENFLLGEKLVRMKYNGQFKEISV